MYDMSPIYPIQRFCETYESMKLKWISNILDVILITY